MLETALAYLLAFEITFYQSWDNHYERKFHYHEQHWILEGNKLFCDITQHQTRYQSTKILSSEKLDELYQFLAGKHLFQDIKIHNLNASDKEMHENRNEIKAKIKQNNQTYQYDLRGFYGTLDDEIHYQNLMELRSFLHKLSE